MVGMAKTFSDKDMSRLLKGFESAGHTVVPTKAGYRVLHSSGRGMITMHLSVSDHRALKNLRRDAIRNGFQWPLDVNP
jgi:hypothetical protein